MSCSFESIWYLRTRRMEGRTGKQGRRDDCHLVSNIITRENSHVEVSATLGQPASYN